MGHFWACPDVAFPLQNPRSIEKTPSPLCPPPLPTAEVIGRAARAKVELVAGRGLGAAGALADGGTALTIGSDCTGHGLDLTSTERGYLWIWNTPV